MNTLFQVFASGRMFLVLLLGFASGLPLALTGGTMQAWLTDAKIDISQIGRFALVGLPYALKFLWAPILDEYKAPVGGRRRGWGILTQIALVTAIVVLAFADPTHHLTLFAYAALAVTFFSASQDIVLDAFRTEILKEEELGAGAGVYVMGYRLAMLVSGAAALGMADHMPWKTVYLVMAGLQALGIAAVYFAPEPKVTVVRTQASFQERVFLPFKEFFRRPAAVEILSFVMIYKLSTMMATSLTTTFLMSLGFAKTEIGYVSKLYGLIATIVGTLAGGALMTRLGLKKSLWIFGILQSMAGLSFLVLTQVGKSLPAMVGVIVVENFMIGLGVAAISGFMMKICSKQFTGTQFALLSSLTAVSRVVLVSQAGDLVKWMGWPGFFVFSVALAVPGLLLLNRFDSWADIPADTLHQRIPRIDLAIISLFVVGLVAIASDPVWKLTPFADFSTRIVQGGAAAVILALGVGLFKPKHKIASGVIRPS